MLARALVMVGVIATTAAAEARWDITLPADWVDDSTEFVAIPAVQDARAQIQRHGNGVEMRSWRGPGDEHVDALFTWGAEGSVAALRAFEDGARKTVYEEVSYHQAEGPLVLTVDHVRKTGDATVHSRRVLGITQTGELWVAQSNCIADAPVCTSILGSLSLDQSRLVRLADAPRGGPSFARRVGRVVGLVVLVLFAGLMVAVVVRVRSRRASSSRA